MNQLGIFLLFLSGALATQVPVSGPSTVGPSSVALTAGVNRSWTAPPPLGHVTDGGGSSPVVRMRTGAEVTMPVRRWFALQYGATYSQTGEIASYLENFLKGPLIEERWEVDYLEVSSWEGCRFRTNRSGWVCTCSPVPPSRCRSHAEREEWRRSGWEIAGRPRPGSTSCSTAEPGCTPG